MNTTAHPLTERDGYSAAAKDVIAQLESRLYAVQQQVYGSPMWRLISDPKSDRDKVRAFIREVMCAIRSYQPRTTEAGFAMLGRLPKHEEKLLMSLLAHKAEEAGHGLWAARDHQKLGGTGLAETALSPAVFAVTGVWFRLAEVEDPFAYLGAEYLFEALTARITPQVLEHLTAAGLSKDELGFIVEHAVEDVKHTNLLVHWILDIATRYPESGAAILRGFDYFAAVYPMPVWEEALARSSKG